MQVDMAGLHSITAPLLLTSADHIVSFSDYLTMVFGGSAIGSKQIEERRDGTLKKH